MPRKSSEQRIRIEDVAKAAGVSMKTVSRVLNNEPSVRDATRERVLAMATEMHYTPDRFARSLAGNRSYLIGLLYDNPSANYLMSVLTGVVTACRRHHYEMVVHPVEFDEHASVAEIEALVDVSKLDGLILTPPLSDCEALLDRLDALHVPYSCVSPRRQTGCIGVDLDERNAACELMEHLIALGHTRIGHIKGNPTQGAAGWRLDGYRIALQRAGIAFDPELVVEGMFSFESGLAGAEALLSLPQPPTAIFAANDDMATAAIRVAHERGLSIPGDVSICGFDNSPASQQIFPPLTTIHQPTQDMGRVATEQLLLRVRDTSAGELVRMPYSLVLRHSTGQAPRR